MSAPIAIATAPTPFGVEQNSEYSAWMAKILGIVRAKKSVKANQYGPTRARSAVLVRSWSISRSQDVLGRQNDGRDAAKLSFMMEGRRTAPLLRISVLRATPLILQLSKGSSISFLLETWSCAFRMNVVRLVPLATPGSSRQRSDLLFPLTLIVNLISKWLTTIMKSEKMFTKAPIAIVL